MIVNKLHVINQNEVDNKEDVSGLYNPSKVDLGGGGGPEVLKDWTAITGPSIPSTEITSDLSLSSLNGLTVEFSMSSAESGTSLAELALHST